MTRKTNILTWVFLLVELILYGIIMTAGEQLLVWSSFISIVFCFLYALTQGRSSDPWIIWGLACTVAADFFLVVCSPIQRLWGMIFFLIAQTLYAVKLQLSGGNRRLLISRLLLIVLAEGIAVVVLQEKTDLLALISLCYYANLVLNIIEAFAQFRRNRLLAIGFVLFLMCDTVIGLQVMAGIYLPISENSWLYRIIFMNFNLSWFFYLPSQVLIALSSRKK